MSILKVIEVLADSEVGFEDAVQSAVKDASKSVRGIKSVYIQDMSACVEGSKVTKYRINAKITFVVED